MRVLLFIDSLVIGGAQRQFLNLALGLQRSECDVHICTYYPLDGLIRNSPIDIPVECFEKSSKYDPSPVFKLNAAIKKFKPEVLVAFLTTPSIYAELSRIAGHSIPIVVSERNGPVPGRFKLMEYLAGPLHLLASTIVFNNQTYKDLMGSRFPLIKSRSVVIHNSVDPKYFTVDTPQEPGSGQQAPVVGNDEVFRFCCVSARPTTEKGLFDLIDAVQILKKQVSRPFRIDWIGPHEMHQDQFELAHNKITSKNLNENWRWLGERADLESLYKQYDALLIPSHREGLSNVLCEAMASGLPIVATDIADQRLILEQSGAGLLCTPGSKKSLAKAMQQLMQLGPSDLLDYGRRARSFAVEHFDTEKTTAIWLKTISDAADSQKRQSRDWAGE